MSATQPAYQLDRAGLYLFETVAHQSPLEPGVFLVPAGCTLTPLPPEFMPPQLPAGQWPRFNGSSWHLVNQPEAAAEDNPVAKLQAFLAQNPDVAALLGNTPA